MLARRRLFITFGVAALLAVMLLPVAPAGATGTSPRVFPPHAKPFGVSYGEWSARWWQQTLALHGNRHPNDFDEGEVPCALGTRRVAFLVGTTGGDAKRSCTIRRGKPLLVPLINGECSEIESNGSTDAELRACAATQANAFNGLHASVDGRAIAGLRAFRFASPLFRFRSVSDNPFGVPATPPGRPSKSVADGYWIMLHPLAAGVHMITFGGTAEPTFPFTTSATYTIRVVR